MSYEELVVVVCPAVDWLDRDMWRNDAGGLVVCIEGIRIDLLRGSLGPLGDIRLPGLDKRPEGIRDIRGNAIMVGEGLNASEGRRGGRDGSRRGTPSGSSPHSVSNVVDREGFLPPRMRVGVRLRYRDERESSVC